MMGTNLNSNSEVNTKTFNAVIAPPRFFMSVV